MRGRKTPKSGSYGLEWTPVPAFSTSINQRRSSGQKETQFGLTFNYHFGMDWEDQLSPAMVTEMRTVDGSRHDFVNRQNEMILAYRAKDWKLILSMGGGQPFVTSSGAGYMADVPGFQSTATAKVTHFEEGGGAPVALPDGLTVTWTLKSVTRPSGAWWNRGRTSTHGLAWGNNFASSTPEIPVITEGSKVASISSSGAEIQLTDIVGSRSVTLEASVCIGGGSGVTTKWACLGAGGDWYTGETTVSFGDGPLSVFSGPPLAGKYKWADAIPITSATQFPAATACGGTVNGGITPVTPWTPPTTYWTLMSSGNYYAKGSKLPKYAQLRAVAMNSFSNTDARGAAAAGWPADVQYLVTGEVLNTGNAADYVPMDGTLSMDTNLTNDENYVCLK